MFYGSSMFNKDIRNWERVEGIEGKISFDYPSKPIKTFKDSTGVIYYNDTEFNVRKTRTTLNGEVIKELVRFEDFIVINTGSKIIVYDNWSLLRLEKNRNGQTIWDTTHYSFAERNSLLINGEQIKNISFNMSYSGPHIRFVFTYRIGSKIYSTVNQSYCGGCNSSYNRTNFLLIPFASDHEWWPNSSYPNMYDLELPGGETVSRCITSHNINNGQIYVRTSANKLIIVEKFEPHPNLKNILTFSTLPSSLMSNWDDLKVVSARKLRYIKSASLGYIEIVEFSFEPNGFIKEATTKYNKPLMNSGDYYTFSHMIDNYIYFTASDNSVVIMNIYGSGNNFKKNKFDLPSGCSLSKLSSGYNIICKYGTNKLKTIDFSTLNNVSSMNGMFSSSNFNLGYPKLVSASNPSNNKYVDGKLWTGRKEIELELLSLGNYKYEYTRILKSKSLSDIAHQLYLEDENTIIHTTQTDASISVVDGTVHTEYALVPGSNIPGAWPTVAYKFNFNPTTVLDCSGSVYNKSIDRIIVYVSKYYLVDKRGFNVELDEDIYPNIVDVSGQLQTHLQVNYNPDYRECVLSVVDQGDNKYLKMALGSIEVSAILTRNPKKSDNSDYTEYEAHEDLSNGYVFIFVNTDNTIMAHQHGPTNSFSNIRGDADFENTYSFNRTQLFKDFVDEAALAAEMVNTATLYEADVEYTIMLVDPSGFDYGFDYGNGLYKKYYYIPDADDISVYTSTDINNPQKGDKFTLKSTSMFIGTIIPKGMLKSGDNIINESFTKKLITNISYDLVMNKFVNNETSYDFDVFIHKNQDTYDGSSSITPHFYCLDASGAKYEPSGGKHNKFNGWKYAVWKLLERKGLNYEKIEISDNVRKLKSNGKEKNVSSLLTGPSPADGYYEFKYIHKTLTGSLGDISKQLAIRYYTPEKYTIDNVSYDIDIVLRRDDDPTNPVQTEIEKDGDKYYIYNTLTTTNTNINNNIILGATSPGLDESKNVWNWNITNTNVSELVRGNPRFNQPLTFFNSNTNTDLSYMLTSTEDYNQDIMNWDTINTTSIVNGMRTLPQLHTVYPNNLRVWNVNNITAWNNFGHPQSWPAEKKPQFINYDFPSNLRISGDNKEILWNFDKSKNTTSKMPDSIDITIGGTTNVGITVTPTATNSNIYTYTVPVGITISDGVFVKLTFNYGTVGDQVLDVIRSIEDNLYTTYLSPYNLHITDSNANSRDGIRDTITWTYDVVGGTPTNIVIKLNDTVIYTRTTNVNITSYQLPTTYLGNKKITVEYKFPDNITKSTSEYLDIRVPELQLYNGEFSWDTGHISGLKINNTQINLASSPLTGPISLNEGDLGHVDSNGNLVIELEYYQNNDSTIKKTESKTFNINLIPETYTQVITNNKYEITHIYVNHVNPTVGINKLSSSELTIKDLSDNTIDTYQNYYPIALNSGETVICGKINGDNLEFNAYDIITTPPDIELTNKLTIETFSDVKFHELDNYNIYIAQDNDNVVISKDSEFWLFDASGESIGTNPNPTTISNINSLSLINKYVGLSDCLTATRLYKYDGSIITEIELSFLSNISTTISLFSKNTDYMAVLENNMPIIYSIEDSPITKNSEQLYTSPAGAPYTGSYILENANKIIFNNWETITGFTRFNLTVSNNTAQQKFYFDITSA